MKGFMIGGLSGLALLLAFLDVSAHRVARGSEQTAGERTSGDQKAGDQKAGIQKTGDQDPGQATPRRGLQIQELEDPVEYLEPVRKRTVSEEARLDALAHFARGRILSDRGDRQGALAAYEKAVEIDPTAVPVYRVLIRLAIDLRRVDDAVKWVTKATEVDPADQQFLMQAVALLIDRRDLSLAIRVLERASRVPGIDKHSMQYVGIMRDLAVLNIELDRKMEAVAGLEVVFDALQYPDKYKISLDAQKRLLNDKFIRFEKIGQAFLEAKKTELALAAFLKAVETTKDRPTLVNLSYSLAQVYLQADKPEEALAELQKYINAQGQKRGRAAYELLAQILAKMDKSADLIPRLEAAAERDSRNSTLLFFLADQYAEANRLEDAEKLYKKTLDASAEVAGYLGLAGVYRRQQRAQELLDVLVKAYGEAGEIGTFAAEFKAIIADQKLLDSLMKIAADTPQIEFVSGYLLANIAADAKQSELAEKMYRHLLAVKNERSALIYEELGSLFFDLKKYAEAAKVYEDAADDADLSDKRPIFLVFAARSLELAGETKRAVEAMQAALDLSPNNPFIRYQEAWIYYHAHKFDEAIERMEKLIADFPRPQPEQIQKIVRSAQSSLSNIYVLKGDITRGEQILERVYRDDPEDFTVNNDLGYLYADQGKNLEQAEAMIRKALAAEPENGAYLDSMGWVLFKREKYAEALPYLEKAVKNSPGPGDETLWEHLGDVQDRLKKTAEALEAWKHSLELSGKAQFPDQKLIDRVKEKVAAAEKK